MSLTQDIATKARHRGLTPWQLVQKIGRLEREADTRTCQLVALTTEVDGLKSERDQLEQQLDTAGIELSGEREDHARTVDRIEARHAETVDGMQRQIDDLTRRLTIGVLAEAAASQTQEIDARSLQARFADGPVVGLHNSPLAVTDPGQTSWGAAREADDTPAPAA